MKLILWTLTLCVAVAMALFAVSNRDAVAVDLWPLPFVPEISLYLLVLLGLLVGFFLGGIIAGAGAVVWRARAAARTRDADLARRDVRQLKARIAELEEQRDARRKDDAAVPALPSAPDAAA